MYSLRSPECSIKSIKFNRHGQGDDPDNVAIDVKIVTHVAGAEMLTPLLGDVNATVFWCGDDGQLSFPNLGKFDVTTKLQDAAVKVGDVDLNVCQLTKLKCKVKPGKTFDLEFNLSSKVATAEDKHALSGYVKTEQGLNIECSDLVISMAADDDDE